MADATPKKQHTIEYVAIGALVVVAIIIGIARFKKGDTDDEVFSRKEFNKKWKEVEILEAKVPKNEKEIVYAIEDDKAPFKSPFDEITENKGPEEENVVLPEMKFQGMVWKSSRPQAIINSKVYDIKDVINVGAEGLGEEIKIKDITKDGIHLIYKNKEFIVRPK
ncbi:MAG: hypothetical protein A2047_00595 [Omnitrophica bacterium GWA2_41_15]|nr:MAG: hypothetical protein A2047_00595 [Omnitrophica bacterium GWA2_41_15]